MNNLMNTINYRLTGGERPNTKLPDFISARRESKPTDDPLLVEIEIYAAFHTLRLCKPAHELIKYQIETFKKELADEIFGEFRDKLLNLRSAIYNDDTGTALSLTNEVLEDTHSM